MPQHHFPPSPPVQPPGHSCLVPVTSLTPNPPPNVHTQQTYAPSPSLTHTPSSPSPFTHNTPFTTGHSCLVPVTSLTPNLKALYVFVEIAVDATHLVAALRANLEGACVRVCTFRMYTCFRFGGRTVAVCRAEGVDTIHH